MEISEETAKGLILQIDVFCKAVNKLVEKLESQSNFEHSNGDKIKNDLISKYNQSMRKDQYNTGDADD